MRSDKASADDSMNQKVITILTILIAALSLAMVLAGLCSSQVREFAPVTTSFGETIELYQKGLYARDSVSMATQAIAQDRVTLIVGIPLLLVSLCFLLKKSCKGLFLLTGTAGYFLYTYTSYSFLMTYNAFYLLYVLLMALSFYDFVLCMIMLYGANLKQRVSAKFPARGISIFFGICGLIVMGMWLGRIAPTILTDTAPYGLEQYSTLGIQSLDLGFVVPACFVTAWLLYQRSRWGYLLSTVLLVKMVTMAAAVSTMGISMYVTGIPMNVEEIVVFPVFTIFSAVLLMKVVAAVEDNQL